MDTKDTNSNKRYERLGFGIFLLFLGTIALLMTTNVISFSTFLELFFTYWPAFIIVLGVKILVESRTNKFWGLMIDVLFMLTILFFLTWGRNYVLPATNTTPVEQVTNNVERTNTDENTTKKYEFTFGASDVTMTDSQSDSYLTVTGPKGYVLNKTDNNGEAVVTLRNDPTPQYFRFANLSKPQNFNVKVGALGVPGSMELTLGASSANVTLDESLLTNFTAIVGAGDLNATLRHGAVPKTMTLKVGAGKIKMTIDKSSSYRIDYALGAGSLHVRTADETLDKEFGGIGANGLYETAPNAANTISVSIGAGAVEIVLE